MKGNIVTLLWLPEDYHQKQRRAVRLQTLSAHRRVSSSGAVNSVLASPTYHSIIRSPICVVLH